MLSRNNLNFELPGDPQVQHAGPLAARLNRFVTLSSADVAALDRLPAVEQVLPAGYLLAGGGVSPDSVSLNVRGIAFRYKNASCGGRQILGFIVPGDLVDPYFATMEAMDHDVQLLGECVLLVIARDPLLSVVERYPAIEQAISLCAANEQRILREWLLNMGQRNAVEKVSHFLGEMAVRLRAVGMANDDGSVDLPISQSMLADTTGLTLVHINRTLQHLRDCNLITISKRRITVINTTELLMSLGFDSDYLYRASREYRFR